MPKMTHIIKLKPLEDFFFGGERTFGNSDLKNDIRASFFAASNYTPQQTTLLGVLRYILLEQTGCLPLHKNRTTANDIIGKKSFCITNKTKQSFGYIQSISPLMILRGGNEFLRFVHPYKGKKVSFESHSKVKIRGPFGVKNELATITDFDVKHEEEDKVITSSGKTTPLSSIFTKKAQVGIDTSKPKESFFKQEMVTMDRGYQFVFLANLKLPADMKLQNTTVFMGGEKKRFLLSFEEKETSVEEIFPSDTNGSCIELLSDALLENGLSSLAAARFSIMDSQDFRTVIQGGFGSHKFKKMSVKYNLLKKGSALFFNNDSDKKALCDALDQAANFKNIGYNQYIIQ